MSRNPVVWSLLPAGSIRVQTETSMTDSENDSPNEGPRRRVSGVTNRTRVRSVTSFGQMRVPEKPYIARDYLNKNTDIKT